MNHFIIIILYFIIFVCQNIALKRCLDFVPLTEYLGRLGGSLFSHSRSGTPSLSAWKSVKTRNLVLGPSQRNGRCAIASNVRVASIISNYSTVLLPRH